MGIRAFKTLTAAKVEKTNTTELNSLGSISASKFVVLNSVVKEQVSVQPVSIPTKKNTEPELDKSSWRADKDGRKSSFLQDMLS